MADYMGKYNALMNLVARNGTDKIRKDAVHTLIRTYDTIWKPRMQEIFVRTPAPPVKGTRDIPSVDTAFDSPYMAEGQGMAGEYDYREKPFARGTKVQWETTQGVLIKELGPTKDPYEFPENFHSEYLSARNQILITEGVKAMQRTIELNSLKYAYGDQNIMNKFGNQWSHTKARLKIFDAAQTDSGQADYLGGSGWNHSSHNILRDINKINLEANVNADEEIKKAFIGAYTAFGIQNNKPIQDLISTHYDLTDKIIGKDIMGINFIKVLGQTYKKASVASNRLNYVNKGNVSLHTYDNKVKHEMMVENSKEWGIFTTGPIGKTYTLKTHPKHKNTNDYYIKSWGGGKDSYAEAEFSEMRFGFAPFIDDFSKIIIVKNLSPLTAV